jgi:dTMP kinase
MSGRYPGVLIVFEGGEGAGKTTQLAWLATVLLHQGRTVRTCREPGGTPLGSAIRGMLLDPQMRITDRAEALLYAADRAEHVTTVIRPALEAGDVVLCDRFVDSSIAYQGAGRRLGAADIGWLSAWATGGLQPDLVVLLDIAPEAGLERTRVRRGAGTVPADRLEGEGLAFHRRVRQALLARAQTGGRDLDGRYVPDETSYLLIDAELPTDQVASQVADTVGAYLQERDGT